MLHNSVLASATQQHESATGTRTSPHPPPSRLAPHPTSRHHRACSRFPLAVAVSHMVRYTSARYSLNFSRPHTYREGNGTPLQDSCLENPMDGGAWWAAVHGVAKSRTRLSNFTFTFHFRALEKEMAAHSSVLAWRIPGPGEPGGLPSMGSHRVGRG